MVPLTTLDAVTPRAPSFVKIDVEGFEHEVLKGAAGVLAARPVLQLELTEHLLRRAGSSTSEVLQVLRQAGYRTGYPVIERGQVRLHPTGAPNIIAVPAERWDEVASRL